MPDNLETNVITDDIKNDSMPNQCENTGGKKKWSKLCPKCGKEQVYFLLKNYNKAIKLNRQCRNCMFGSVEYKIKHKINSSNMWKDEIHINKLQQIHNSEEYKRKRRIISQKILNIRFGKGNLANVSKKASEFINYINKTNNWNLQHAFNGGEYEIGGYSLDGYDKEKNIVLEYDEPYHYDIFGKLREKDIIRQKNIINELNPFEFWRYDEKRNKLYNILDKKETTCHKV